MTEPTRDALHAETLGMLEREDWDSDDFSSTLSQRLRYAAACVRRVPELEAEVERLRAIVRDFAVSPIEHEDPRIEWVTMQVERDLLTAAQEATRPTPRTDG